MKKAIYKTLFWLVALTVVVSCKRSQLDDLHKIDADGQKITGEGIVTGQITKDNESVKVPFRISLSGPAAKAFQVGLTLNNDTVNQLINNGTLTNTILMPNGSVAFPNVIDVKFGTDSATGVAVVRLSTLERNYGKKIAFALKLNNPEKGNTIVGGKSNILVVINTSELFAQNDIHYVSIATGGGGIYNVDHDRNQYLISAPGITIPLRIALANQASSAFDVRVKLNRDTITELINNGILPANTIQLGDKDFSIDTLVRIPSNVNFAYIRLSIPWPVFDANIVANKKFAFAVSLEDPTKHVLDPVKSKVIVLVEPTVNLDNNSPIIGNGTGLKAEYYSNNQFADFDGRAPTLTRIDETIDFGGDWLPSTISRDNYSSRWTGEFLAPVRGDYIFYQTRWDDGSRLFIDGKAIIDDYTTEWDKDYRKATIHLERGIRYKIRADHRENVGGQQAHLEYEVPGVINGKRIVPKTQLFPAQ